MNWQVTFRKVAIMSMQEQVFLKLECRIPFSVRCPLKTIKVTMIHYDIKVTMIKVTMIFIVVIFII